MYQDVCALKAKRHYQCFAKLALAFSILFFSGASAKAQEITGTINGTATDSSGAAVPDAQIKAVGDRVPNGLTTKTDSKGYFNFVRIPIGLYSVTTTASGFTTVEQKNVNVTAGSVVNVSPALQVANASSTVDVVDTAVSLDVTSSKTETTVSAGTFNTLARDRTFNSLLAIAPGARSEVKSGSAGVGGIQVDGSSGLENRFYLDGMLATNPITGALNQNANIPLDFIQDLNIRTGGFEAQYGGATGGVITVAVKSGSNAFHGGAFMEGTGNPLNAGDRGYWQLNPQGARQADFFRPREDNYSLLYPGGFIGGPILKNRLFFFEGYNAEIEHTDRTINYLSGAQNFKQYKLRNYNTSKLDFNPFEKLQVNASWIWAPTRRSGTLPNRDPRVPAPTNDLSVQGGYLPSQIFTTGATYTLSPRVILSGRYGYFYYNAKDGNYGLSGAPFVTYQSAAAESTASSWTSLPGNAGVALPGSVNFPNAYANVSNTLGTFRDKQAYHQVSGDVSVFATLFGQQHNFKAGYQFVQTSEDINSDYTNGRFQVFWGRQFSRAAVTGAYGPYGYYIWQDGVRLDSSVSGNNQGFYIQDDWRIGRRLTINAGVRFENEFLPPYQTEFQGVSLDRPIQFGWGDKIAPRVGAAWDILGDGKWKLSGSFGYFNDIFRYSLAQGAFGGQQWISNVYTLNNPNVFSLSRANPGALGTPITSFNNRTIDVTNGVWTGVDPSIKPFRSRNINVGLDHQLASRLIGSIRYTRKDLIRGVEDIGVLNAEGSEVYTIGNPGYGLTRDTTSEYGRRTPNGQSFLVPRAVRQYDSVEVRVQGNIKNLSLIPSYTWSRLYGNYAGLGNSDEAGRSDPNVSRAFDLPYYYFDQSGSQRNVLGLLGTDRPHTFKLFSSYRIPTKLGETFVSVTQLAFSGTPDSTSVIYQSAPTYPYGRGDLGRVPAFTQTDLQVSHTFKFTETKSLKFTANFRNLFNQATVLSRASQINQQGAISSETLSENQFFAGYNVLNYVTPTSTTTPLNPIYGLPGVDPALGGTRAGIAGGISSAYSATYPNVGAYQDFRVIRLGAAFYF